MHHLGRFLLTCVGLGLLLGVVLAMIGIYRGMVVVALAIDRFQAVADWTVVSIVAACTAVHSITKTPATPTRTRR